MAILKGVGDFFSLDIGTNAVRVVQLSKSGNDTWALQHYGYVPVDERTTGSDSAEAKRRLGEVIMTAIGQSGIKARNVVIGLPSSKTFITVVDMPNVPMNELKATMKYQMDQYIPTAIEETKVDWALLGQSLHDTQKQEVLLASTSNQFAEERLEFIESLGLNVIAAEPDPIAMVRSLLPSGVQDARLIIDMGEQSTDIAITYGDSPRLIRTIPTGVQSFVRAAVQNLNVQDDQARQFILKFGLAPDRLEGQVLRSLTAKLDIFASELNKSVKFFQTRYPDAIVGGVLLSGFSSVIPQLGDYIGSKTGIPISIANPWQKVKVPSNDQQLAAIAHEFAAAVGLAQKGDLV